MAHNLLKEFGMNLLDVWVPFKRVVSLWYMRKYEEYGGNNKVIRVIKIKIRLVKRNKLK